MVEKLKNDANPIYDMIRRSNRNLMLISVVGLIASLVAFSALSLPYFMRQFSGPHPISAEELAAIPAGSDNQYWVQVDSTELIDSGYYEYTTENGVVKSTDAYFAVTFVGDDKILLVRQKNAVVETTEPVQLVGTLTSPTSISREVYDEILIEAPEAAGLLLPMMLDTVDNTFSWYMGAAALAVVFFAALVGLFIWMSRSRDLGNHPILRDLRPLGDPDQIVDQIYAERTMSEQQINKNVALTRNWLVYQAGNDLKATRVNDVVWVYKQVVQNKYGKNYFAHIHDRHGRLLAIPANEQQVNDILNAVGNRAPWVVGGHNNDIKKTWDKNRQQFIADVDARRKQMSQ